jgi:hypothetical protein
MLALTLCLAIAWPTFLLRAFMSMHRVGLTVSGVAGDWSMGSVGVLLEVKTAPFDVSQCAIFVRKQGNMNDALNHYMTC